MKFKQKLMMIKGEFGPDLNSYKLNTTCLTHLSHLIFDLKRFRCLKECEKKICTELSNFFADFPTEILKEKYAK